MGKVAMLRLAWLVVLAGQIAICAGTSSSSTYASGSSVYGSASGSSSGSAYTSGSGYASGAASSSIAVPTHCPNGGSHIGAVQQLKLSSSAPGASVHYTTDGTAPSSASTKYTTPLTLVSNKTVCAIAVVNGSSSNAVCKSFTVTGQPLTSRTDAPVFSQNGGVVRVGDKVSVTTNTSAANIYYSASKTNLVPTVCDFKAPEKGVLIINFATKTTTNVTISAFASMDGLLHSEIRSATFVVKEALEDFSIGLGASRVKFKEQEL